MTRILLILLVVTGTCFQMTAQSSLGINYQAVVRGTDGTPLSNQDVSFRFRYAADGDTTNIAYEESFTQTTNEFGLVNLVLTFGTPVSGSPEALDFATVDYWIITELDVDGGTNYEVMGISPLEKVPYAEVANTARNVNDADADPANELQQLTVNGDQLSLSQGGGSVTLPPSEDADADPENELELPSNPSTGDLAFYNGETQQWEAVPPGQGGQTLTLSNDGTPKWAGLSTEMLLEVSLPNGEILYAHPTDNNASIGWNPAGSISETNGLTELRTASFPEFSQNFSGESQTAAIVEFYGDASTYAAKTCTDLVAFGFDDWFLPSGGELLTLINSESSNLTNQLYWTSNLDDDGDTVILNGATGTFSSGVPTNILRCVRK